MLQWFQGKILFNKINIMQFQANWTQLSDHVNGHFYKTLFCVQNKFVQDISFKIGMHSNNYSLFGTARVNVWMCL